MRKHQPPFRTSPVWDARRKSISSTGKTVLRYPRVDIPPLPFEQIANARGGMLHNFAISAPAEIKGKLAGSHTESVPARPLSIKIPTLRGERSVRVRVGHKPTSVFKHYPPPTYRRTTHKGGIPAIRPKQMNIPVCLSSTFPAQSRPQGLCPELPSPATRPATQGWAHPRP